ncbi:hypothetical protein HBI39_152990 [Parastagonospora nodorum]|nr:hypothetical protein HBI39_152990 [Parastagonospora nodorum]
MDLLFCLFMQQISAVWVQFSVDTSTGFNPRVTVFPKSVLLRTDIDHTLLGYRNLEPMSQSNVPWTNAAIDPCLPSIEQETYTQEQLEEAFAQATSPEPVFTPVFSDDLDDFDFSIDITTHSHATSVDPSASSTPDFSSYTFNQTPSAYPTVPNTPQPYPIIHQQTQPTIHHCPLPFRTKTNSPLALPSHSPQGYDRRRSLSHGDIDRIAAPPHPTFIRLQGAQAPRIVSYASGDNTRPDAYIRHGRSASQGPSHHGRPLKNAIPYSLPGSPLVGATHIGTPLEQMHEGYGSRKRVRPVWNGTNPTHDVPYLTRVTDPARLRRSRHIIEVGAMAVRKYAGGDVKLEEWTVLERVMKKVGDVEEYLKREGGDNADALKGCEIIRQALERMDREESTASGDAVVDADVPSKMMDTEDGDIFGGCLGEDGIMGLLMREDEVLGGDQEDV